MTRPPAALALALALAAPSATTAEADPQDQSCALLTVLGDNAVLGTEVAIDDLAARWAPQTRAAAQESLGALVAQNLFAGGTAYRLARFGDDLEEHLLLLRLRGGEVAAIRLIYEWAPDGPTLTVLDFKRRYTELPPAPYSATPQPLDCP